MLRQHLLRCVVLPSPDISFKRDTQMAKLYQRNIHIICFCAMLGLTACRTDEPDDPIIVPEVEKEFVVEMRERPGPAPRSLQLHLRTVKNQDCTDLGIQYEWTVALTNLRLDILGIRRPANCMPGQAPAQETVTAGVLPEGLYDINIKLRNAVANTGTLLLTEETYYLNMQAEEGLVIPIKQLRRIPEHIIWGYVGFSAPSMASTANSFVNELAAMSAVHGLSAGHYGHFQISSGSGSPVITGAPIDLNLRTFVYRFTGNADDLRNLVQAYRNSQGNLLQIRLQSIQGQVF